jgi:mono/diheme cytochrome c family protein
MAVVHPRVVTARLAIPAAFAVVFSANVAVPANGPSPGRGAGSGAAERTPGPAVPQAPLRVFRASCLECHDGDGRGDSVRDVFPKLPDFTDEAWHAARTDSALGRSILEGKGKSMPRMKNKLGSVDVKEMVALVRAFQGGKLVVEEDPEPAPEATSRPATTASPTGARPPATQPPPDRRNAGSGEGGRLFQRLCQMCHGADGRGALVRDNMPTVPDFTRREWQERRRDPQLMVSILDGKGTGMPPFRGKLVAGQVRELVARVRAFDPTRPQQATADSDDFDARFQRLLKECVDLGRQVRALSPPGRP